MFLARPTAASRSARVRYRRRDRPGARCRARTRNPLRGRTVGARASNDQEVSAHVQLRWVARVCEPSPAPVACLIVGVQPAPVYTARFTNAAALAASVPIWSRTLGPAILIGREHGSTLLVSDDRPSGAPTQKSKQHQDHVSDSHNAFLSFAAVIVLVACNHALLSGAKKNG
jgi:hypothetical protein